MKTCSSDTSDTVGVKEEQHAFPDCVARGLLVCKIQNFFISALLGGLSSVGLGNRSW